MNDKLTHDERRRLECLAQSVAVEASLLGPEYSTAGILQRAAAFADFVKDGVR